MWNILNVLHIHTCLLHTTKDFKEYSPRIGFAFACILWSFYTAKKGLGFSGFFEHMKNIALNPKELTKGKKK